MLMQISSAHGPLECQLAAANALRRLQAEADAQRVVVTVLDAQPGERPGTLRSALLDLDGEGAQALADRWTGTLQWICASRTGCAIRARTGSSASRAAPTRNRCRMAMCGSKRCAHAAGRPAREQDDPRFVRPMSRPACRCAWKAQPAREQALRCSCCRFDCSRRPTVTRPMRAGSGGCSTLRWSAATRARVLRGGVRAGRLSANAWPPVASAPARPSASWFSGLLVARARNRRRCMTARAGCTACRVHAGCRVFRTLSAQERTLEASAIITCRGFAHHVSNDRYSPPIRPFHWPCGACRHVVRQDAARRSRTAGPRATAYR